MADQRLTMQRRNKSGHSPIPYLYLQNERTLLVDVNMTYILVAAARGLLLSVKRIRIVVLLLFERAISSCNIKNQIILIRFP